MSEENFAPHRWVPPADEFEIMEARLVATLGDDRGVIMERLPRLQCTEGRLHTFRFLLDGEVHTLDYDFRFGVSETEQVIPITPDPAQVVISGKYRDCHVEIRGAGWIGYDQQARIGGRFETPPSIKIGNDQLDADKSMKKRLWPTCTIIKFPERTQSA